jgi:ribonuclease P protein component
MQEPHMPKPRQRESDRFIDSSPPSGGLDRRLSRNQRLTRSALFTETFAQNRKWVGRYMVLWLRSGDGASLRLGVITSRKVHLRANRRNRARRLLREAYRRLRPFLSGDCDVILVGRRAILDAEWKDVLRDLLHLAGRAGLITEEDRKQAERECLQNNSGQNDSGPE